MINKKLFLLCFLVLSSTAAIRCAEDRLVEIDGQSDTVYGHIARVAGQDDSFLDRTDVFTYEDGTFIRQGGGNDILCLSRKIFGAIEDDNCIYVPCYTKKKARTEEYENIGAIIAGTRDEKLGYKLFMAVLKTLVKEGEAAAT